MGSQKQKKVQLILVCDSIGHRRGAQEGGWEAAWYPGGKYLCIWAQRKVNTRNQLLDQFFKHWGGNDASPASLCSSSARIVCFSFAQESRIFLGWWNRTWKEHHSVRSRMLHCDILKEPRTAMFNTISSYFLPWRFPVFASCFGVCFPSKSANKTNGIVTVSTGRPLNPTPPFYKCTSWSPVRYNDLTKATQTKAAEPILDPQPTVPPRTPHQLPLCRHPTKSKYK